MKRVFAMAWLGVLLVLVGIATGVLLLRLPRQGGQSGGVAGTSHLHAGPSIAQVRGLSSLVVLRAEVADVQVTQLRGYTGGVTAALVVKGDVTFATDLSAARFDSAEAHSRTAVLVLPPPGVRSPRLDHERSRLVCIGRSGLWRLVPDGERAEASALNKAYAEAQRVVEQAAAEPSLDQRARAHAESVLTEFFAAFGWTLTVR